MTAPDHLAKALYFADRAKRTRDEGERARLMAVAAKYRDGVRDGRAEAARGAVGQAAPGFAAACMSRAASASAVSRSPIGQVAFLPSS